MLRVFTLVIVVLAFTCIIGETINGIDKICEPVDCKIKCSYGYEKKDGCEICKCYDPCNPFEKGILCESNQQCFVEEKSDGIFAARCESTSSLKNRDICEQDKYTGLCMAAFQRFYYDKTTKKCELFIYGGCNGNKNNFRTEDECKAMCEI